MNRIVKKVEDFMTGDGESPPFPLAVLLSAMSVVYGGGLKLRQNLFNRGLLQTRRLPCPVISVGNLTVGGTGKTPMTMYVSKLIQQLGYQVVIVSRGYKGRAEKTGGIVSNGRTVALGPEIAGDEPYMMAKRLKSVPVVVGKNRFKAGMLAVKQFAPDVVLLDDAFQHRRLFRDVDLVLLDCRRPFGNRHLLPRGTLREPIFALMRSAAVVMTRTNSVSPAESASLRTKLKRYLPDKPIFGAYFIPDIQKIVQGPPKTVQKSKLPTTDDDTAILRGRHVFAFSGLADDRDFLQTVKSFGCVVVGDLKFPDHHPYSDMDVENIVQSARKARADCLVTTEKDQVRVAHRIAWPLDLAVIGIACNFGDDAPAFNRFIKIRLEQLLKRKNPG